MLIIALFFDYVKHGIDKYFDFCYDFSRFPITEKL